MASSKPKASKVRQKDSHAILESPCCSSPHGLRFLLPTRSSVNDLKACKLPWKVFFSVRSYPKGFAGSDRRMGSGRKGRARRFNQKKPKAAFFNHMDRPFKQPEIRHVIMPRIRQIQNRCNAESKPRHVVADNHSSAIELNKVKVEQRWLERTKRDKVFSKLSLRHKLFQQQAHRRIKLCVTAFLVSMPPKVFGLMRSNLSPSKSTRPTRGVGCIQPRVTPNRHICEDQRRNRRKQALGHISSGEGQFGCHPQQGQVHMMPQERSYQPNLTNTAYTGEQTPSFQRALQSTPS